MYYRIAMSILIDVVLVHRKYHNFVDELEFEEDIYTCAF